MPFLEIFIDTKHPSFIEKGYTSERDCLNKEGFQFSMMSYTGFKNMWQIFDMLIPEEYNWPAYLTLKNSHEGQSLQEKSRLLTDLATLEKIEPILWPTYAEKKVDIHSIIQDKYNEK